MADLDFYVVLGVLPDAEEVVIAASHRALAKRYHPDLWKGDPAIANKRMTEINQAYEVLGNAAGRAEYDKKRANSQLEFCSDDTGDQTEAFQSALNEVEEEWATACSIFPDLADFRSRLAQISTQQAFAFVTVMLSTKEFNRRAEIAAHLERVCMEHYFGNNEHILDYAITLILGGHKEAAKDLNHLVSVMGPDVDPQLLIQQVKYEFPFLLSTNEPWADIRRR